MEDYLKYWRVIRYYFNQRYKLTSGELDMLLFLSSEGYFDKSKFQEFNNLLPWNKDRFEKLRKEGWIDVFRKPSVTTLKDRRVLYSLSYKANHMITSIYKKLSGEEIPTNIVNNAMYKKNVKYTDKVYRMMITDMTKAIRQQRHLAPE